jgi:hypothetical protein
VIQIIWWAQLSLLRYQASLTSYMLTCNAIQLGYRGMLLREEPTMDRPVCRTQLALCHP